MASTTAQSAHLSSSQPHVETRARTQTDNLPWYLWCAALAVTSVIIGAHWDISWHSSIGRDTFWTPAHMAIYLCGVLAGVAFGYIILRTTFSKTAPLADASVHIWGFRAPLGAFIASWGGIAMLTSAPFDNWWHDAYGLDVKIISPPHILLFIGVYGVMLGTLILIAGQINRSNEASKAGARWLFLYVNGTLLTLAMVMFMEYTDRAALHSSTPYIAMATLPPIMLAIGSRVTGFRWAATFVAGFYTLFNIGLILILPLFPAEPKLGPVYQHVTQFIPPEFPLLMIVPAFALDLLWQRTKSWNPWKVAAVSSVVYLALLLALEWPFASFLMTPAARNRFFGTMYLYYALPPTSFLVRNLFIAFQTTAEFWRGILWAAGVGVLSFWFGIARGEWMRQVKR